MLLFQKDFSLQFQTTHRGNQIDKQDTMEK